MVANGDHDLKSRLNYILDYCLILLVNKLEKITAGVLKMATHKSAEKRNRQNKKTNLRNRSTKATMKSAIKAVKDAITSGKKDDILKALKAAQSTIAKTVRKGVVHKKTGSRYVSRLTTLTNK